MCLQSQQQKTANSICYHRLQKEIKVQLTFFGDGLHARDSISSRWRFSSSRFIHNHCWRVFPLSPIDLHSWKMIIYLERIVIRCSYRARQCKLVRVHVHWPVDTFLDRSIRPEMLLSCLIEKKYTKLCKETC